MLTYIYQFVFYILSCPFLPSQLLPLGFNFYLAKIDP